MANAVLLGKNLPSFNTGYPLIEAAGCEGYGKPIVLIQTDTPSIDPIGAYGTDTFEQDFMFAEDFYGPSCGIKLPNGYTATTGIIPDYPATTGVDCGGDGNTILFLDPLDNEGSSGEPMTPGLNIQSNFWGMMFETAPGECDHYICANGQWKVNLDSCVSTLIREPFSNCIWTDTYIVVVDSDGVFRKQLGHTSMPDGPYVDSLSRYTYMLVDGKATTFHPGDKVVILYIFSFYNNFHDTDSGATSYFNPNTHECTSAVDNSTGPNWWMYYGPQMGRDATILTPMYDKRAVFVGKRIYKAKESGERDVVITGFGCGKSRIGKRLKKGIIYGPDGDNLRDIVGFADCCEAESGSGTAPPPFLYGGGCYPPGSCGGPGTPGNFGSGCDLRGYPGTVYLNISDINRGTNPCCQNYPSSVSIPLYWNDHPFTTTYLSTVPVTQYTADAGPCWIGWYLDAYGYYLHRISNGDFFYGCTLPLFGGFDFLAHPLVVFCILQPCQESESLSYGHFRLITKLNISVIAAGDSEMLISEFDLAGSDESASGFDLLYSGGIMSGGFTTGVNCPTGPISITL